MKKRPINIHSSNKTNIIDLNNRKNYFSSKKSSSTTTTGTTSIRIPTTTATTTTRRLKRVGADFRLEIFCIFRNDNAQNFGFKIKINQNQVQSKLDFFSFVILSQKLVFKNGSQSECYSPQGEGSLQVQLVSNVKLEAIKHCYL